MKGNLFIGFVALIIPLMFMWFHWDATKKSLDCSSQCCKYTIGDFFDKKQATLILNLCKKQCNLLQSVRILTCHQLLLV